MKSEKVARINADILNLLKITSEIGWCGIREISINRILYLSSVLYLFVYPQKQNPFLGDYCFTISARGPFCSDISNAIAFLQSNEFLVEEQETGYFKLGDFDFDLLLSKLTEKEITASYEKEKWIEVITFILGIYGEDKIYDFVFRDPEYESKIQINDIEGIDISINNETYKFLNEFKKTFEEAVSIEELNVDPKTYLKLYFEYVFSIILKGEIA